MLKEEYPPETLFENKVPLQIKDKAPLVWIPLPSLGHMAKNRDYFNYFHATSMVLRHKGVHKRDGSVEFKIYANLMYGQMLKEGRHPRKYRHDNYKEWGWYSNGDLLWFFKAGCDKPRFELLAPRNCSAGGNLDALVHTGENVVAIRAIGGHTKKAVDPAQMNRVKVTHKTFPR